MSVLREQVKNYSVFKSNCIFMFFLKVFFWGGGGLKWLEKLRKYICCDPDISNTLPLLPQELMAWF